MRVYTFHWDIYKTMFENEECWFISCNGNAMLIPDASLADC